MTTEIRSYRSVFDLERRIYRIDRLRLNPAGVPLRGLAYFLALVLVALFAQALPLASTLVRVLPWYLRELALPACAAALLGMVRIDGRPAHVAACALLAYALGPRRVHGSGERFPDMLARWRPDELIVLPDGSEGRLRRLRCSGPAHVRVRVAHERVQQLPGRVQALLGLRERVTLRELRDRRPTRQAHVLTVRPGTRLLVR